MKIVCISDTHNQLEKITIPDGDILIHSGDFSMRGTPKEIEHFNIGLGRLPHKTKIVIAGNHDWGFQKDPLNSRNLLTNAIYLEDTFVEVSGLKIYGSPWQPTFFNWAFNLNRGEQIAEKWNLIPEDVDILITHGPPAFVRDIVHRDRMIIENVGCVDLLNKIGKLHNLKAHIFGHIHEQHGVTRRGNVDFVNASILDDNYIVRNAPIVLNI